MSHATITDTRESLLFKLGTTIGMLYAVLPVLEATSATVPGINDLAERVRETIKNAAPCTADPPEVVYVTR